VIGLAFAAFLLFGVMLVLVGANQAELARDLQLDLARSGLLASLLAAGLGAGVLAAGPLVDRLPRRPLFVAASLVVALGLGTVSRSMGFTRAGAHLVLVGMGLGVYETLLNAVVGERYGARAARPLLFVHAAATLGAMLGPALAAWITGLAQADWSAVFRALGAAHLPLAAAAFAVAFPAPPHAAARTHAGLLPAGLLRALLPLAAIGFAYVGVETAVTVLAVPYATLALGLPHTRGLAGISAFWAGLLLGRLAVLAVRGAIDARHLAAAGAAGALVLAAGVAAGTHAIELLFAATGACLGLVFPVMVALTGEGAGSARATAIGLVVGAGALGGFLLPWLHGALGDLTGPGVAVGTLAVWPAIAAAAARSVRRARVGRSMQG
jgi:fucose permease